MSKQTAEIIIRHLLGIVAALQKEYGLKTTVTLPPADCHVAGVIGYTQETKT
jgi:hypothetical protein